MGPRPYVEDLTELLNAAGAGDNAALDRVWRAIHDEIHEMARRACQAEGTRANLQPTLLVNELFLKMFGPGVARTEWDDRRHFWVSVGRALGQFLSDLARSEGRLRRGGGRAHSHRSGRGRARGCHARAVAALDRGARGARAA